MGHGFDEMKMCGPTFSVWTGQDSTVQYLGVFSCAYKV